MIGLPTKTASRMDSGSTSPSRQALATRVVDRGAHGPGHGLAPLGIHHHVGDAAHQDPRRSGICGFWAPTEAAMRPDSSETRCMATVVEPMSQAMP